MKKILLIAYYYPPAAGVGTFRVTKFTKYLPEFGWSPYVLTVKEDLYSDMDKSILEDTKKAAQIYRTNVSRLPVNDVGLKWAPKLLREAKKIIKAEKIDLVYYTGGPFFQWLVAPRLKKVTGVPYVLDYRDPWGINPYEKLRGGLKKKIGDILTSILEPKILGNALNVIFATKDMKSEYEKFFPGEFSKFCVIENGFDEEDYIKVRPKKFSKFTIAYTGKFSHYRNPENLFKALKAFGKNNSYQFIHVGHREQFVEKLGQENMGKNAKFVGPQDYQDAISYAKGADVLVLISGGSNIEFTHKVFDYISCNKPIIAVVDKESYLGRFLESFENAFIVNDDASEILKVLKKIKEEKIVVLGADKTGILLGYDRKLLTKALVKVLESTR